MITFDKEKFARHVKLHREGLKITLRDVAEQTGVSPSTLSRIENNEGIPDIQTVAKLCVWMQRTVEYYLNSQFLAIGTGYTDEDISDVIYEDTILSTEDKKILSDMFVSGYRLMKAKYE